MVKFSRLVTQTFFVLSTVSCSYAPGLHIPDNRFSYNAHDNDQDYEERAGLMDVFLDLMDDSRPLTPIPVTTIDADVISAQDHEQAKLRREVSGAVRTEDIQNYEYRVGPHDVLAFTVWDHPELTSPSAAANAAMTAAISPLGVSSSQVVPSDAIGHGVSNQGTIFFPYVGEVPVAGRTLGEIRSMITRALGQYIIEPQVDVRIVSYRSKRVYVTGEIKNPGMIPITDTPLTIVDAIARAQGFTPESEPFRVRLVRGKQNYILDLNSLFDNGDLSQNWILQDGDIVNVPDRKDSKVYVMGEVMKADVLHMNKGHMSLAESINLSGGLNQQSADAKRVFVIRGVNEKPTSPLVYHLDLSRPDALLLSTRFELKPLDVVYVSTADLARWNRVISGILPTITTLSTTTNR
ncbi:polysaccharide biosynthesis/export protein [Gammaproteobacteria bacterium]